MAPDATPACSVCGNRAPQPLLICFECSEGTDINGIVTPTGYCSPDCRSADKDHVKKCKIKNDRKCLYRAGDLLQAVLYEWCETAFVRKVKSVWKDDNILCFVEEPKENWAPDEQFFPIPDSMFESLQDKHKLLALDACAHALVNNLELIRRALKDLTLEVIELDVAVDPYRLAVRRFDGENYFNHRYSHQVLAIEMTGTWEQFIVDISGAQYAFFDPVIPHKAYFSGGDVLQSDQVHHLGHAAQYRASNGEMYTEKKIFEFLDTEAAMRRRFKAAIDEWETLQAQTVSQFLSSSSKSGYEKGKHILLAMVHDAIQTCIDNKERTDFRINEQAISPSGAKHSN